MRINRFISIICLFVLSFTMTLDAQTPQQRETLLRMSDEFERRFEREKAEAVRLAESLGLVIREEFADGTVMELMRFKDGMPMYYITHNKGGGELINSDKVYPGGSAGLNLTGAGQTLGIWDSGKVRDTHVEFQSNGVSRVTQRDGATNIRDHATHVAGTMVGGGVDYDARGMSYQAFLDAYDWNMDLTEMTAAAADGLQVSQHSYGFATGWNYNVITDVWYWHGDINISETEDYFWGFYCTLARLWDEIAFEAPNYLIVKSAGNDRNFGPPSQPIEHYYWEPDVVGWATSTAIRDLDGGEDGYKTISDYSNSKNIMVVGAVWGNGNMSSFSGWGPTDDGRIKPDVVAKGVNVYSTRHVNDEHYGYKSGTSMSGPMVSGSVGLLLEHQANLHPGEKLLASTIKALILHSADSDIGGEPGPDYSFGWGLMDTERAAQIMTENSLTDGIHINEMTLTDGYSVTMPVKASGLEPLRATIVWTDPPGTPPQPSLNPPDLMLVNDLDMRITNTEKTEYMPYILDPANPSNPATTGDNYRDNVEMIHIDNPTAEEIYTITITHKGTLTGGSQDFSLIITGNMGLTDVANPHSFTATAIDASQIDLDWTKNNDGDDVMLVWSPDNVFGIPTEETIYSVGSNIPGGGTVLFRGSGTDFSHTGLAGATTYYYRAYSYDETDSYSTGINASAMTDCGVITILPFEENFDSSLQVPLCWTVTDNIGNGQVWQFGTILEGLTGTTGNYAYVDSDAYGSGNTQNTGLITPVLDLSGYVEVALSFTHYFRQWSQSKATLFYSVDGGNTWVEIQEWFSNTDNPSSFDKYIPEVAGESSVMFKWLYTADAWQYYWCVDDIRVSGMVTGAHELVITSEPGETEAGVAITPAPAVRVDDAFGNPVADVEVGVSLNKASFAGTVTQTTDASGIASFDDLVITEAGTGYELTFSRAGLTAQTSAGFDVTSAAAAALVLTQQPTQTVAGAAITPAPAVQVDDQYGNPVSDVDVGVSLNKASFAGTVTQTTDASGIASFGDIVINTVDTGYELTFSSAGLTAQTSDGFDVTSAAAAALVITQQPTQTEAGAAIDPAPAVRVDDQYGNPVSDIDVGVSLNKASFAGTVTQTTDASGIASFDDLVITEAGTGYELTFISAGLPPVTSDPFAVTSSGAHELVITTEPGETEAGAAITPAPAVRVDDQYGNPVSDIDVGVSLNKASFAGTVTQTTDASGIASFDDLVITEADTGYELTFISAGLPPVTSDPFAVTSSGAHELVITSQPGEAEAGAAITPAPAVRVDDQYGNPVSDVDVGVSLNKASFTGTVTQTTDASGIASFDDLVITEAGTGYELTFISAGLTPVTSDPFAVTSSGVPETRSLSNKTVTDGDSECFDATQTITVSDFVVESGGSATLIAGQSITLLPGTHIQSGGYFHAWITTDDTYCGEPVAKELDPEEIIVTVPEIPQRIREDLFFKVYPNPTDGSFTLELETTDQDKDIIVDIMNMLGERVLSDRLPSQNIHTLTLEGQRPGMYIIRVTKGARSGVERLIKR